MSASLFSITEHVIPCQHIREYPRAVKSERAVLQLAIKEYRPLDNLDAAPGSVTIIAAHANGIPKETYEPLWDDLHRACRRKIRAIWIADMSHQGQSGVLNENLQGDDPSYFDHSRDLLRMINHFQERMVRPILGIAHSMGAPQLVHLSLIHPRLFHSLCFIEPVIESGPPPGPNAAMLSSYRQDLWPSRSEAEASLRKSRFFREWDLRALDKFIQHGLRDTPTAVYPSEDSPGRVTLTTTKHQEAWSYVRSNFSPMSLDPDDFGERLTTPDIDGLRFTERAYCFNRADMVLMHKALPHVRPSVFWIFGSRSPINTSTSQDEKMKRTGAGVGGNGGANAGKVQKASVQGGGHMVPLERIQECAKLLAGWVENSIDEFEVEEKFLQQHDSMKSARDMLVMSRQWLALVKQEAVTKRPMKEKL